MSKMSLHPETLRIRLRLEECTRKGRRHWDLHRDLSNSYVLLDATRLVIANDGASGLDGQECRKLRGREWEVATGLSEKLRTKRYVTSAVRRAYIPKKDGTSRPLGIPSVDDRVVQRALMLLLEPIYEQVFLPCSYGFRPGKRSVDCVYEVSKHTFTHRAVFDADIEKFFDRVVHRKLLGMLREQIVDKKVLELIAGILKSGFCEWSKPWQPTPEGTPQGGPLSPMLANIYLHYAIDTKFSELVGHSGKAKLFRFADDLVIVAENERQIRSLKSWMEYWLKAAGLELNAKKTRVVDMRNEARSHRSKFDFLGFKLHLRAFKDNPKRFWIARQPSEKARRALREKMSDKLHPNLSLEQASEKLQQIWRGWSGYFRYGNSNRILHKELRTLRRCVMVYLRRKFRQQRRPVQWGKLVKRADWILASIKVPHVIPDPTHFQQARGL